MVLALLAGCGSSSSPHTPRSHADICLPHDASQLARAPKFTLLLVSNGVSVCTLGSETVEPFSDDAIPVAVAVYGPYAAATEDVCPGGFEGCWVGVTVLHLPSRDVVTTFHFGTSIGRLAVGAHGALAFITCRPLDENAECQPGASDERELYRLDRRGLKRIAGGPSIRPSSLRTLRGGRAFTWRQDGRTRTSRWTGAPPVRLS
jgi:hypothetical protein